MKIFAFQKIYSEQFDPYFVYAADVNEACSKIRRAYPLNSFNILEPKEIPHPGLVQEQVRGIHTLEVIGALTGDTPHLYNK